MIPHSPHNVENPATDGSQSLLNDVGLRILAEQVLRVIAADFQDEEERPDPGRDVRTIFQSSGAFAPTTIATCRAAVDAQAGGAARLPSDEVVSLAFAACVYPQRGYRMAETERLLRFEAFLKTWLALKAAGDVALDDVDSAVQWSLRSGLHQYLAGTTNAEVVGLWSDLSAADFSGTAADRAGRISGALLYLGTCCPQRSDRIWRYWREERAQVRFFREVLSAPVSQLMADAPDVVREGAARAAAIDCPEALDADGLLAWAAKLERDAAACIRRNAPPHTSARLISQLVADMWQSLYGKLVSGFPYYAFCSKFRTWWRSAAVNYSMSLGRSPRASKPKKSRHVRASLDPQELDCYRENYRLVRASFFRNRVEDAASENEQLRGVVDALWQERLSRQLTGAAPSSQVQEIRQRYGLQESEVNNTCRRLRMRMWATGLARWHRLRNSEILAARDPYQEYGRTANWEPLRVEAGILNTVSLAKAALPDQTLLWALIGSLWLRQHVIPQRRDPWNFGRFIRELWHWLVTPAFAVAVELGFRKGNRPDATARQLAASEPIGQLLAEVTALEEECHVDDYVGTRDLQEEQKAVAAAIREIAGDVDAAFRRHLPGWRCICGRRKQHWIVPVWYLTIVERLEIAELLDRLAVDDDEQEMVIGLACQIKRDCGAGDDGDAAAPAGD